MQSAKILTNLQKFLILLDPSLRLNDMLTNVARQLVEMFGVDHSGVLLFNSEDRAGLVIAEYPLQAAIGLSVPLTGYPLVDQLKVEQKPIAVLDAQNDPIMGSARPTMRALGIESILIMPLVTQGKIVGSLSLDTIGQQRRFTSLELDFCAIVGNQIAVAVDYTRALEAAEESRRQAQTLRQVNRVLSESLNLDKILPLILEQLEQVIPVDGSSIYLLVEEGVQLMVYRGGHSVFANQQIIPLDRLWGAAEIVNHKSPLLVGDTQQHPHWHTHEGSPVRSWLGVPLIVRGEVVGILNMDGYTPNRFNETHIPLAFSFANQSAMAIYNARLYGQAKKRAELLASVQEIGVGIAASLDLKEVFQAVTTSVLNLLNAGQVRIYLYNAETDSFSLATMLADEGQLQMKLSRPRKDGVTARVARTGQYIAIPNILGHPLYNRASGIHGFRAIASVPLRKLDKVLGVLNVFYAQTHHFSPEEIDVLHLLATQAAVALENARLYSSEQARLRDEARRAEQWRRVQEISSTLNASLDLNEVLSNAAEQCLHLIEVDHCAIVLFDEALSGQGCIVAEYPATGALGQQISVESPAFRQMLQDRQPFASAKAQEDPRLSGGRANLKAVGVQSVLIAPLVVQDRIIGSIGLDAIAQPRHFTDEELNIIRIVADQMAIAIANARTYQAERAARLQADTLRQVAATLNETLDLNQVLTRILAQLERVITFDSSSIILREGDIFRIVAARGFPETVKVKGMTFVFTDTPHFQEIARTRQPLAIPDTKQFPGWRHDGPTPIRSWIGLPLLVSNRLIGLLSVDHMQANFYSQTDCQLATGFADLAAIALENARLYEVEVKQVEQELSIAGQIQRGFFPQRIPELPGWDIAAVCIPARETGGDFYEFVERADGTLGIVVGDVSGKSIPAAMLMASAQSVVSSKGSDYRSPAKVMSETNRLLYGDVPQGSFVAVSYALLRADNSQIYLSNSGQLAPFLVPVNGQPISLIETPGNHLPLGVLPRIDYQEMRFSLNSGDALVFFTDGLIEQNDKRGQMFGFDGASEMLEGLRGQTPEIMLRTLLEASRTFAGDVSQHDDITLVVVQRAEA